MRARVAPSRGGAETKAASSFNGTHGISAQSPRLEFSSSQLPEWAYRTARVAAATLYARGERCLRLFIEPAPAAYSAAEGAAGDRLLHLEGGNCRYREPRCEDRSEVSLARVAQPKECRGEVVVRPTGCHYQDLRQSLGRSCQGPCSRCRPHLMPRGTASWSAHAIYFSGVYRGLCAHTWFLARSPRCPGLFRACQLSAQALPAESSYFHWKA